MFHKLLQFIFLLFVLVFFSFCRKSEELFFREAFNMSTFYIAGNNIDSTFRGDYQDYRFILNQWKNGSKSGEWAYYSENTSTCMNFDPGYRTIGKLPFLKIDSLGYYKKGEKIGWWYYFVDNKFSKTCYHKNGEVLKVINRSNKNEDKYKMSSVGLNYYTVDELNSLVDSFPLPIYYFQVLRACDSFPEGQLKPVIF